MDGGNFEVAVLSTLDTLRVGESASYFRPEGSSWRDQSLYIELRMSGNQYYFEVSAEQVSTGVCCLFDLMVLSVQRFQQQPGCSITLTWKLKSDTGYENDVS